GGDELVGTATRHASWGSAPNISQPGHRIVDLAPGGGAYPYRTGEHTWSRRWGNAGCGGDLSEGGQIVHCLLRTGFHARCGSAPKNVSLFRDHQQMFLENLSGSRKTQVSRYVRCTVTYRITTDRRGPKSFHPARSAGRRAVRRRGRHRRR